ncbi:hypothetical protein LTR82_017568 [Friedmanniomyces endolithicus]|uniref:Uncharacterized protein n=1 Tax=Friedmanniomyces endolithicus TaxID=329885 RepID=A0AAN6J052_9PEZI|nr:hypothetical protein LTR82_017568 [Friedmanniomyces endolithicus]
MQEEYELRIRNLQDEVKVLKGHVAESQQGSYSSEAGRSYHHGAGGGGGKGQGRAGVVQKVATVDFGWGGVGEAGEGCMNRRCERVRDNRVWTGMNEKQFEGPPLLLAGSVYQ